MTHASETLDSIAATDDDAQALICWSRSGGLLSQSGAAEDELKTRVPGEAGDAFRRLARSHGMTTSEFLRVLVLTRVYGVDGVVSMTAKQLAAVAGVGTDKAQV